MSGYNHLLKRRWRVLNLTMQEAERYKVISEVEEGYLKVKEAAGILGLSERQVYRIKARVEREGREE
jgi:transposase